MQDLLRCRYRAFCRSMRHRWCGALNTGAEQGPHAAGSTLLKSDRLRANAALTEACSGANLKCAMRRLWKSEDRDRAWTSDASLEIETSHPKGVSDEEQNLAEQHRRSFCQFDRPSHRIDRRAYGRGGKYAPHASHLCKPHLPKSHVRKPSSAALVRSRRNAALWSRIWIPAEAA